MTYYYYKTNTWSGSSRPTEEIIEAMKFLSEKKNWRIVKLPNGYYQTEHKHVGCGCEPDGNCNRWQDITRRETIEAAEEAIDSSIDYYKKRLNLVEGPKVVKTFE